MSSQEVVGLRFEDTKELNQWARHVSQTYVAWYTGFFAFNAAGLGYVITTSSSVKALCHTFVLFNLLGVLSSLCVMLYGRSVHKRLTSSTGPLSPFPVGLWFAITGICGLSLGAMAVIWFKVTH